MPSAAKRSQRDNPLPFPVPIAACAVVVQNSGRQENHIGDSIMTLSQPKQSTPGRWWDRDFPPLLTLVICCLGITLYWALGVLGAYGLDTGLPIAVQFALYFAHWTSVGALIEFLLSARRRVLLGAAIGSIASALLLC